jgi:prepilin-type N-terminal cleavage/methylation domain-containing protein
MFCHKFVRHLRVRGAVLLQRCLDTNTDQPQSVMMANSICTMERCKRPRRPKRPAENRPVRVGGQRGFTLLEILIVLAVMATLIAIAMPKSTDRARQAVRFAVDRFASAHSLARATGIRMGRMGEFHIDAANSRFWVEVDTTGTGVTDTVGMVSDLSPESVTMTSTRSLLCFDGRGLPDLRTTTGGNACQPGDATVVFSRDGVADTLEITALGKVIR